MQGCIQEFFEGGGFEISKLEKKVARNCFLMTFFLMVRINFSEGGVRSFLGENPSKMKKFFSYGGFDTQTPPSDYAPGTMHHSS